MGKNIFDEYIDCHITIYFRDRQNYGKGNNGVILARQGKSIIKVQFDSEITPRLVTVPSIQTIAYADEESVTE